MPSGAISTDEEEKEEDDVDGGGSEEDDKDDGWAGERDAGVRANSAIELNKSSKWLYPTVLIKYRWKLTSKIGDNGSVDGNGCWRIV